MDRNKSTLYELFPEELPELGSGSSLADEIRLGARERLEKRSEQAVLRSHKKRPQPTVHKLVHPSLPKYKKCAHSGNFILDREALNRADHTKLISTPKDVNCDIRPHYVVRKLPSITNRIKTLARPGPTHVRSTLARYASKLSAKQKQHLQSLLEPKPFVTISESIGYARQQRTDDAMWRRHRAKQERKLLKNIRRWEVELLKEMMKELATMVRDYYLFELPTPLEEDAKRIARSLLQCIYRLLNRPVPVASNDNVQRHDAIDEFYIEFSEKVGHWIWRLMEMTGVTFVAGQKSCSILRKSASFVSVNSSVFEMQLEIDNREHLDPLSILSLELINDCLDEAILTVENGKVHHRENSIGEQSKYRSTSTMEEIEREISKSISQECDTSFRTSMELDGESGEQLVNEDQITVIENIPNDPRDPGPNREEEITPQTT